MRRRGVNMSLAPHRLIAQPPGSIHHHTEEQVSPMKISCISAAANIHCDTVNRIGTVALRISQARAYLIQPSHLGNRPRHS